MRGRNFRHEVDAVAGDGEDGEEGFSLEEDRETRKTLLREIISAAQEVELSVDACITRLNSGPDLSQGISFLDLKNGLLAEYNANLTYLMLQKTRHQSTTSMKLFGRTLLRNRQWIRHCSPM